MGKYFKETSEEKRELVLSEYLKKGEKDFKNHYLSNEEDRIRRTEYLIKILGDVSLDEETYLLFIDRFQSGGGRYDVMTRDDTFKGMYEIIQKHQMLTSGAIKDIWVRYIKDLFDEYDLITIFDNFIQVFGLTDEAFEMFIDYVEKKAEQHQQKYVEDSLNIAELEGEYTSGFISHIKNLILSQHYSYDEIKKCMPCADLIERDEQHIRDLSRRTRIYFGCCRPISYSLFDVLLKYKSLDGYPETLEYCVSTGKKETVTFTKTDFLESVQKQQGTSKRKK